jgi:hypothetical protein
MTALRGHSKQPWKCGPKRTAPANRDGNTVHGVPTDFGARDFPVGARMTTVRGTHEDFPGRSCWSAAVDAVGPRVPGAGNPGRTAALGVGVALGGMVFAGAGTTSMAASAPGAASAPVQVAGEERKPVDSRARAGGVPHRRGRVQDVGNAAGVRRVRAAGAGLHHAGWSWRTRPTSTGSPGLVEALREADLLVVSVRRRGAGAGRNWTRCARIWRRAGRWWGSAPRATPSRRGRMTPTPERAWSGV